MIRRKSGFVNYILNYPTQVKSLNKSHAELSKTQLTSPYLDTIYIISVLTILTYC